MNTIIRFSLITFLFFNLNTLIQCSEKPYALYLLEEERQNIKRGLIDGENKALEEVKHYFGFDDNEWTDIITTVKKEHTFNIETMRKKEDFNFFHHPFVPANDEMSYTPNSSMKYDSRLTPEWLAAIDHACTKYGINRDSLCLGIHCSKVKNDMLEYAYSREYRPIYETDNIKKIYNPALINVHLGLLPYTRMQDVVDAYTYTHCLQYLAAHELTHIMQGHLLYPTTIQNFFVEKLKNKRTKIENLKEESELLEGNGSEDNKDDDSELSLLEREEQIKKLEEHTKKLVKQLEIGRKISIELNEEEKLYSLIPEFEQSTVRNNLIAAQEKTADLFLACDHPKVAKNACCTNDRNFYIYPANHNDIKRVYTNWQATKIIKKQQKSLPHKKKNCILF